MRRKVIHTILASVFTGFAMILLSMMAGCTSNATRQAIINYEKAEVHQQTAADNALRIANEQMYLNLIQYIKAHPDQADQIAAIKATWRARNVLEDVRMQYTYARTLNMLTTGQYLYDKQGWFNAMVESKSSELKQTMDAVEAGNQAAGINNVSELKPGSTPAATSQPTNFYQLLKDLGVEAIRQQTK